MIIDCICGLKKFIVDQNEIPSEGRQVKCGVCSQVWFYNPKNPTASTPITEDVQPKVEETNVVPTPEPEIPAVEENPIPQPQERQIPQNVEEVISQAEQDDTMSRDDLEKGFVEETPVDQPIEEEPAPQEQRTSKPLKIFADDEGEISKSDMDENLEKLQQERKKNKEEAKPKTGLGMRLRMMIYLLIILLFVLSIFSVPYKQHILMAFPGLGWYFDAVTPYYIIISKYLVKLISQFL
jgi:predicted Zn finger-like uncharacterized protein